MFFPYSWILFLFDLFTFSFLTLEYFFCLICLRFLSLLLNTFFVWSVYVFFPYSWILFLFDLFTFSFLTLEYFFCLICLRFLSLLLNTFFVWSVYVFFPYSWILFLFDLFTFSFLTLEYFFLAAATYGLFCWRAICVWSISRSQCLLWHKGCCVNLHAYQMEVRQAPSGCKCWSE